MKRVIAILLCLLCAMCIFVACNDNEEGEHTHTYKTDANWSKDAEGHWYAATCDCTDAPIRKLAHTDANNDGACDVCTYTDHTHTYSEDWTADCTNHWHAVDCGHYVAPSNSDANAMLGKHEDSNEDGKCDVCNYVIEDIHQHYYATEWTTDGEYHWHAALCEHKIEVLDKAAHELNAAGFCTACQAKIKDIDKADIGAILAAAVANNHKVVSGNVVYVNNIPDLNYTLSHEVYYVLGDSSSYIKRIEYGIAKQRWFELLGADNVFGVTTEDGGFTITSISADLNDLKGYNYTPSTMLGSYDTTSTLADTLYAIYDISLKDTVKDKVVEYNAETGEYTISYTYLEVVEHEGHDSMTDVGNDESTADKQVVVVTSLYEVEAIFTIDENYVINKASFVVGAYNQDIDHDYTYNVETGEYVMSTSALADTYSYEVAQVSGDRAYYTAYPKASLVPSSFDLAYENGEIAEEEIKTTAGTFVQFYLTNLEPFSALPEFIDPNDFTITTVDKATGETAPFEPFYSTYSGTVCFNPNTVGSYTMTIKYGDFEKTYTLTVTPAVPTSIKLYPFVNIQGYGEMVYTVDEGNSVTKIELDVGETIDFLIRVNPAKADQLYTITVDSEDASISDVTLTNVVAFYEILEECKAYQFKSDVEGKYTITLTSKVDETVTSTVEVYVGNVEQDVKTSEIFEIPTPGNFDKSESYVFTADVAGKYVITAENNHTSTWIQVYDAVNDSWTRIESQLPYSVDLEAGETVTLRLYGWDETVLGQVVTVKVEKEASANSATYEVATPGDFDKSDEFVFTAEADATYVVTAENLDASTWLQIYDAANDSWTRIESQLPYSMELAAGESATFRLYGWDSAVAGQMVTVTVAPGTAGGDDDQDDITLEGAGTEDSPFILPSEGDYNCAFPGGYWPIWYQYTAEKNGTLTLSTTMPENGWLKLGTNFMYADTNDGSSASLSCEVTAGTTYYIGVGDWSENASTVPFNITISETTGGNDSDDDEGGDTTATGKEDAPFTLVLGENELLYKGYAYGWAFYTFTATEAGNLTITMLTDDYDLAYGTKPMWMTGYQISPMVCSLAAGETIYIGVTTKSGGQSDTPIRFTASFEASAADATEDELKTSLGGFYNFSDEMDLFFMYSETDGVYLMEASAPDYSWDIYFTYTLTNNNDGTYTITPTYFQREGYEAEATQVNIDRVLNTLIVANYNGTEWSFGTQGGSDDTVVTGLEGTYTATDDWDNSFEVVITGTTIEFAPPMSNPVTYTYEYANGIITIYNDLGLPVTMPMQFSLNIVDGVVTGMTYNGTGYSF